MALPRNDLAQYDFYNPFMSAVIIDRRGNRVPLWTDLGRGGEVFFDGTREYNIGTEFGIRSLPFLQELSVKTNLGEYPIIRATLTPPYREGIAFLDSPLIEWGTSILEVEFGYVYGTAGYSVRSPPYQGVILKPDVQIGPEIVVTLNAQGIGAFSMSRHERGRTFRKEQRMGIINQIIDSNKAFGEAKYELDPDSLREALGDPVSGPLLRTLVDYSQGFKSDLEALWDVVKDAQCWLTFIGPSIHLNPRGRLTAQPKCTLTLFDFEDGAFGPGQGVFPILNASSPTMAVYLPSSSVGLLAKGESSRTGKVEEILVGPQGQPIQTGATKSTALDQDAPQAYFIDPDHPRIREVMQAEYERSRTQMGVKLEIDSIGIPDILPGDVVKVLGLGVRISGRERGNYGVFTVTHTYGVGGFTTSLTCVSNTSSLFRTAAEEATNTNMKDPRKSDRRQAQAEFDDVISTVQSGI